MIRLLIADDHPIVREGLKHLLAGAPDVQLVGEAGDTSELPAVLARVPTDVLLLDISMPGPGFLEILAQLRQSHPDLRVLVLSVHAEELYAVRALQGGARGYLTKQRSPEELLRAIRHVYGGGRYVSPTLAEALASQVLGELPKEPHEVLSQREYQVLSMVLSGKSGKQIALELELSPKTVSSYRARVLQKLGLESNAALIRYGLEHGLAGQAVNAPDNA